MIDQSGTVGSEARCFRSMTRHLATFAVLPPGLVLSPPLFPCFSGLRVLIDGLELAEALFACLAVTAFLEAFS